MTGRMSILPIMSNITLSLLADTGWYTVNPQSADVKTLVWGSQMQCSFGRGASDSGNPPTCSTWPSQAQQLPYRCTKQGQEGCTFDRAAAARCSLPSDPATDLDGMCMLLQPWANVDCTDPTTKPRVPASGESAGTNGRCFDSSLSKGPTESLYGTVQSCYETACAGPTRLKIKVDGLHYNCPPSGSVSPIDYSGRLTCPSDYTVCIDAVNDPYWPEFGSIEPGQPSPGDSVTILGSGFTGNITSVTIGDTCSDMRVVNRTRITCTLAGYSAFANPVYVLNGVNVIIRDSRGRTAVGQNVFKMPADSALQVAFQWMRENALYTGLISAGVFLVIVGLIVLCCCCCRKPDPKRRAKNRR
eukprot:TRINITY_DN2080_c0_g1_i1.p1 TRINITY_DN2080_c0_g1~~TRINITY_DN2080_c0_g1_i1.p1  ORF type:complete len:358 (-),score=106.33 TRINITY_DN2080_c0_g1_i1:118-1191(-)